MRQPTIRREWASETNAVKRRAGPDTFKVSNDPRFDEKLVDVAGLHLNPPYARAVVFSFDESVGQGRATVQRNGAFP